MTKVMTMMLETYILTSLRRWVATTNPPVVTTRTVATAYAWTGVATVNAPTASTIVTTTMTITTMFTTPKGTTQKRSRWAIVTTKPHPEKVRTPTQQHNRNDFTIQRQHYQAKLTTISPTYNTNIQPWPS